MKPQERAVIVAAEKWAQPHPKHEQAIKAEINLIHAIREYQALKPLTFGEKLFNILEAITALFNFS